MQPFRKFLCLALCFGLGGALPASLPAKTTRSDFDQAVEDLKSSPDDQDLRNKIIDLSHKLKSLPKTPDEVLELKGQASYIMKTATSPADYQGAVDAYKKAALVAPWVADVYYNLGVVEQKADQPADASNAFKLYLRAKPDASDKAEVLERLGALDLLAGKKKQTEQTAAARQQQAAENSVAVEAWQKKQAASTVVVVLGAIGLCAGAVELGLGFGNESSSGYTTAPGVSGGVLYNQPYEGKYWSKDSLASYTAGQSEVTTGWVVGGIGLGVLVVGLIIGPGPKPGGDEALLELSHGQLAVAVPSLQLNRGGGLDGTLLHATF
jgi:tetratricopeptide (TPR) repeat protein